MQSIAPKELSDEDLVARIVDGSEEDFNILYNRYFNKVYNFTHHKLLGHGSTEEVVQEIFTCVFASLGTFEGRSSLLSWIYEVMKNIINNSIRAGESRRRATRHRALPPAEGPCPVEPLIRNIRVVLAEDHRETRERVAAMLAGEFEVVGQVRDGEALLSTAKLLEPDLIVLDISMPILSGTDAADRLAAMGSRAKLVFLTVHEDLDYIGAAFSAGAQAYVVKSRLASDLLPAMRGAIAGQYFVSPGPISGMEG